MSHYHAIAHRIGSSHALELSRRLSSWHDRMVAHERRALTSAQDCDEACPHAEAIELWHAALEIVGEAADRLTFLKTTAANAVSRAAAGQAVQERRGVAFAARDPRGAAELPAGGT